MSELHVKLSQHERHTFWIVIESIEDELCDLKGILKNPMEITKSDIAEFMRAKEAVVTRLNVTISAISTTILNKFQEEDDGE